MIGNRVSETDRALSRCLHGQPKRGSTAFSSSQFWRQCDARINLLGGFRLARASLERQHTTDRQTRVSRLRISVHLPVVLGPSSASSPDSIGSCVFSVSSDTARGHLASTRPRTLSHCRDAPGPLEQTTVTGSVELVESIVKCARMHWPTIAATSQVGPSPDHQSIYSAILSSVLCGLADLSERFWCSI